jgi:hypothetical protein
MGPFAFAPPIVSLTIVSAVVAIGLLFTFKWTSNQRALAETKRRVHAGLFELRLFQDDPLVVLRAAGGLLAWQARYLRYALVPLLWVFLPLSLLIAHLQAYYGYDALRPGQTATIIVHVAGATSDPAPTLTLLAPNGIRVETPCVWAPSRREGAWRIALDRIGDFDLRVNWTDGPSEPAVTKRVRVSSAPTPTIAREPVKPAERIWNEWVHPVESPIPPGTPIDAISVNYADRGIDVLGFSVPWLVVFFVLVLIFTLVGRSFIHVVI